MKGAKTPSGPATWSLYLLECADGSLYAGISTDVARRLKQHNEGAGARYTRARRPVRLVYQEPCASHSAALKRELEVKAWPRKAKLALIQHLPGGLPA